MSNKNKKEEFIKQLSKGLVAYAFRNTHLENIHAGKKCLECSRDQEYSHISDEEMKKLMKQCVNKMYTALKLYFENPEDFQKLLGFSLNYTSNWDDPSLLEDEYDFYTSDEVEEFFKR